MAKTIAARLEKGRPAARTYVVCVADFPPAQLQFTPKRVALKLATSHSKLISVHDTVRPSVPKEQVHPRAQAMRIGVSPADALAVQLPASTARLSPSERIVRGAKRLVDALAARWFAVA